MLEVLSLVELLRVGFMAPFDLSVHLRAARRYVFVGDAEIGKTISSYRCTQALAWHEKNIQNQERL